ncbi:MAG: hypothetical protein R3F19_17825 [Verrucomicrobiales bacterium]
MIFRDIPLNAPPNLPVDAQQADINGKTRCATVIDDQLQDLACVDAAAISLRAGPLCNNAVEGEGIG